MTRSEFSLLLVLGVLCLCLSLVTIVFASQNRKLQENVQAQQAIINKGSLSQQLGANLVREMGAVAQTDEKMRALLQENGYGVSSNPTASPAP
jgi:uncharacterized protein HemX